MTGIRLILQRSNSGLQRGIYLPNVKELVNGGPFFNSTIFDARAQAVNQDLLYVRHHAESLKYMTDKIQYQALSCWI